MAPVVILIRHGEALHNPGLTEKGIEQCRRLAVELKASFSFTEDECRIVVSPLKRTLQTVQYGLQWLRERGVPIEARAEWQVWFCTWGKRPVDAVEADEGQETTANPCDVGTEVSSLEKDWPDIDFSGVDPIYPQKVGLYEASEDGFRRRASFAKRWLFERPEKCIFVVTHSGFLKRALNSNVRYQNVEYRAYELDEDDAGGLQFREIGREKPLEDIKTKEALSE